MEINILIDEGLEDCPGVNWLQSVVEQILTAQCYNLEVEVGLVITSQERIQELNRQYLGRDEPTDVLAFSLLPQSLPGEEIKVDLPHFVVPPDGVSHLGEVIVSYPQAIQQAKVHRHAVKKEIVILVIHGILHILGYDHDNPELEHQMKSKEAEILSSIEEKGY